MTDAERIVADALRTKDLHYPRAVVRALAENPTPAMIEAGWIAYASHIGDGSTNGEHLRAAFSAMLRAETREEQP